MPPTLEPTPEVAEQQVAPQQEAATEKVGTQKNVSDDRVEEKGQQPRSLDTSTGVPDSPPTSFQLPPHPPSFDQNCAPSQAPTLDSGCLDHLSYDQLHNLRKQHGYHRKAATEVSKTRLTFMQNQQESRTRNSPMDLDVPVTAAGKRGRPRAAAVGHLRGPTCVPD